MYSLEILEVVEDCYELADAYMESGAFTAKNYLDALHVATAAYHGCDIVVS